MHSNVWCYVETNQYTTLQGKSSKSTHEHWVQLKGENNGLGNGRHFFSNVSFVVFLGQMQEFEVVKLCV